MDFLAYVKTDKAAILVQRSAKRPLGRRVPGELCCPRTRKGHYKRTQVTHENGEYLWRGTLVPVQSNQVCLQATEKLMCLVMNTEI